MGVNCAISLCGLLYQWAPMCGIMAMCGIVVVSHTNSVTNCMMMKKVRSFYVFTHLVTDSVIYTMVVHDMIEDKKRR